MLVIGCDKGDRTGRKAGGLTVDSYVQRSPLKQEHLLMNVLVRRMRLLAGTQFRQVQFDRESSVRGAIEHGAAFVLAVCVDGEFRVAEDAGRQDFWLLGERGSSGKNRQ